MTLARVALFFSPRVTSYFSGAVRPAFLLDVLLPPPHDFPSSQSASVTLHHHLARQILALCARFLTSGLNTRLAPVF